MGTLIAMTHPAGNFAGLADHTYVLCGTKKKGWKCWGEKTGNNESELCRGTGSTKQADCIAGSDEKAGIKCYLVNGVCHQAANRILMPAEITVRGARGYSISEALFGTYGRIGFWPCESPFNKCEDATGDLPECIEAPTKEKAEKLQALIIADGFDKEYINGVLQIYSKAEPMIKNKAFLKENATDLNLELFMYMAKYNLGPLLNEKLELTLKHARLDIEAKRLKIEKHFALKEIKAIDFIKTFNKITLDFQDIMANLLSQDEYFKLFNLNRDERIILANPDNPGIVTETH